MNWLNLLCRHVRGGMVFTAGFKFCAVRGAVISGVACCVCFCFTSTESLILAQDERWRRALHMQVER